MSDLASRISVKRIYDPPDDSDGTRVLVDRLWPRGVTKSRAAIDLWLKDVAPTPRLRTWFGHSAERWAQFQQEYRAELAGNPAVAQLRTLAQSGPVTLVYAARDPEINHAIVLAEHLRKLLGSPHA